MSSRSRRGVASSAAESDRGTFGISEGKFRVAAPPARPLPLVTEVDSVSDPIGEAFGVILQDRAYMVLESQGISALEDESVDVSIVDRYVDGDDSTKQPTVLIVAPWTQRSAASWPKIVSQLKVFADSLTNNPQWQHVDIAIEMVAPQLVMTKYLAPVVGNSALERDWPAISDMVICQLQAFPQTNYQATNISLFRLGYSDVAEANPITVYISVGYDSREESWPPVLRSIEARLSRWPHELTVLIEHGEPDSPLVFPHVPSKHSSWKKMVVSISRIDQPYQTLASIGADMSASTYLQRDDGETCSPMVGTLGCYLEIETEGQAERKKVALTSYHVMRPAFDGMQLTTYEESGEKKTKLNPPKSASEVSRRDKVGFGPKNSGLGLESPSRSWHNYAVAERSAFIQRLAEGIRVNPGSPGLRREHSAKTQLLRQQVAFFDDGKHHLGRPWAGSGLAARTSNDKHARRLDWGLVHVEAARQASNLLPGLESWLHISPNTEHKALIPVELVGTHLRQPTAEGALSYFKSGQVGYKIGAATGATIGRYNKYRSATFMTHDRHISSRIPTYEHHFLDATMGEKPFALPGDSGAVVFNEQGEVVGLVFGGRSPQQTKPGSYTLVTPIEDVFLHIKKLSGNKIKDIRISG